MASEDFILFLVRKVLWEGELFMLVQLGDHLEDRVPVSAHDVAVKRARLDKVSEHEGDQDTWLVTILVEDLEGQVYAGHLNCEYDKLVSAYGRTMVFPSHRLTPLSEGFTLEE